MGQLERVCPKNEGASLTIDRKKAAMIAAEFRDGFAGEATRREGLGGTVGRRGRGLRVGGRIRRWL